LLWKDNQDEAASWKELEKVCEAGRR